MINELIFVIYICLVCIFLLAALKLGQVTLVSLISIFWVLANLFVCKNITLCGLSATASDTLAVGAILGLNLVQEYYGKHAARLTITTGFFVILFYTFASILHCLYSPSAADTMAPVYATLLNPMPRLVLASIITYLVVSFAEYKLYGFLQDRLKGSHFILRNYASVSITQLLDTILFSFLGLYGIMGNITHIIIVSYAIKLIVIVLAAPFLALSRRIMRIV